MCLLKIFRYMLSFVCLKEKVGLFYFKSLILKEVIKKYILVYEIY